MKIGLVGGGSGGHFYPLIATTEVLQEHIPKPELYYFGPSPYSKEQLSEYDIKYVYVPAGKLRRYFSIQNILDIGKTLIGIPVSIVKLYIIYPDVIFSKGSYTSIPVLAAAWFLRIPVVIHESDVLPGRANKFAQKFARYIAISWPDTAQHFPEHKIALTGIPIRKAVLGLNSSPHSALGLPDDLPILYVTGGSLGAERINNLILDSLNELLPHVRIYHQVSDAQMETVKRTARELLVDTPDLLDRYYISGTVPGGKVAALLDASTLVITRAGSTSLQEIAIHKKPSIVIPIPEEISHDQRTNAYAYAYTGSASVLEEHNLSAHLLKTEIMSILQDTERYNHMANSTQEIASTTAAQVIAEQLISIGNEHGS